MQEERSRSTLLHYDVCPTLCVPFKI